MLRLSRLIVPLIFAGTASAASTCPPGAHQVCLLACFCAPDRVGEMGPIYDDLNRLAASGLEQWLVQSRNAVAAGEVHVIPLNVRVQLEPYYDLQVLEAVRYRLGDETQLNAANLMLQNPDVQAVTLVDIIVFRHQQDALDNVALWAHELKHVQQYQQWGVAEFARRYSRDYQSVEAPAYEMQGRLAKALRLATP
ncbi:DUF4157 domain-containing protein [Pseudomonas sp. sp1636]|uniref:eCIS core domain-containing protein n=1 Tax=Pseudomonas sp. sp1636 TaxID=3036707 RepID=UPI0025A6536F|nr:DUF4157 domain-containing protein [Pseudomonas sp. sp1636]MDM8347331.1 DUF4157 domain-containing protein [Pseudomonas sp. sp1636]